jgi:L-lactate dehydrogenase complex protein LldG
MGAFTRLIANVKTALAQEQRPALHANGSGRNGVHAPAAGREALPVAPAMRRTELGAQFAREFAAAGGDFRGTVTPDEATSRIAGMAHELNARRVTIAAGVALDEGQIARALEHAGVTVINYRHAAGNDATNPTSDLARCDLGIIEADCAIASTGTFVFAGSGQRPISLSLVPPVNLILVHAARLVPDLAAAIAALGKDVIINHRVAMVTGPSRTADIEKMIVIGVHGPKQLYSMIVWPEAH